MESAGVLMSIKTILTLFVFIIIFSAAGNATTIEIHKINVDLKSDGTAHIVANVDYGELTSVDIEPLGISDLAGTYRDDPTLREICEEAYRLRDAERKP